ncbi:MAG: hypothetical protein ACHQC8_06400 [Solirubrobacterales bacterium]
MTAFNIGPPPVMGVIGGMDVPEPGRDVDQGMLRHLPRGIYPTRPTSARIERVAPGSTTPLVPEPRPAPPATSTTATQEERGAVRAAIVAAVPGFRGRLLAAAVNQLAGSGSDNVPAPPVRLPDPFEVRAAEIAAMQAPDLSEYVFGPTQRVQDLQYFLTYLYQEIGGITYVPDPAVSYTSNEILVNDEYYGAVISAYETVKVYAMGEPLPSIEEICRDREGVLFRPFVLLAAANCRVSRIHSRVMDTPRYGVTVRNAAASMSMEVAVKIMRAALDKFLGRKRPGWDMERLRPYHN